MNYTMLSTALETAQEEVFAGELDAQSLYRTLETVQDRRAKRGVRYSVALVLTLIIIGKLVGMKTPEAIGQWVTERTAWLKEVVPCPRGRFPCVSTYRNVLRTLDAAQINEVLAQWLIRQHARKRCQEEPSRLVGQPESQKHEHVALDGKTLRGTQGHLAEDQRKMHQVGLYETGSGVLLKEHIVGDKENELSRVNEFLTPQWVKGRIISADALHTQQKFCLAVVTSGGHYVLFAKGNQSTLQEDLRLFFDEPPLDCRDWRTAESTNSGHGRLEQRLLVASTELNDFLAKSWPGVSQVFRLRRRVHKPLFCTQQIVYGFTSLASQQADPARLLELIQDHWAIENRLHYRRDVTLGEDACQVRKGVAPRVLAVLNSFVLGLFDLFEVSNVARQMRSFDAHPLQAIRLILTRL
jgi:predicted transposase YbfD/YdcC